MKTNNAYQTPAPRENQSGVDIQTLKETLDYQSIGESMYQLIARLYPICRSITGNGLRQTLRTLAELIPLQIHDVASGTQVFDWTVPSEWNIRDAYIKTLDGQKVVDFTRLNLHVLNYSVPMRARVPLVELKQHLFSLPDHPDWVPYRTSYYKENWGFCLSHRQLLELADGEYEVCVDSDLRPGYLSYGEYYLKGRVEDEILLSCHACHPSLCNDNLSGVALVTYLAKTLAPLALKHSYRFLFIPGTIGSIVWLSQNEAQVPRIRHGLIVACVGDPGKIHYKKSRQGNAIIDRAVKHVLEQSNAAFGIREFSPYGYDERQFCSPGFNLPVGSLTRTPHACFPEYHTSADNLDFIHPQFLADSFLKYLQVIAVLERNARYINTNPKCEPQLGKRGLYEALGGKAEAGKKEMTMLWVLNLSDGQHTLLDIAERSGLSFDLVWEVAVLLAKHGLLKEISLDGSTV